MFRLLETPTAPEWRTVDTYHGLTIWQSMPWAKNAWSTFHVLPRNRKPVGGRGPYLSLSTACAARTRINNGHQLLKLDGTSEVS